MEPWAVQLIVSLVATIGSMSVGIVIIAKRIGTPTSNNNNHKQVEAGLQKQVDTGVEGTKTLSDQFYAQVGTCNQLWRNNERCMGKIEAQLEIIIDKLNNKNT